MFPEENYQEFFWKYSYSEKLTKIQVNSTTKRAVENIVITTSWLKSSAVKSEVLFEFWSAWPPTYSSMAPFKIDPIFDGDSLKLLVMRDAVKKKLKENDPTEINQWTVKIVKPSFTLYFFLSIPFNFLKTICENCWVLRFVSLESLLF